MIIIKGLTIKIKKEPYKIKITTISWARAFKNLKTIIFCESEFENNKNEKLYVKV
jgi:hypothetical protein